MTIRFIHTLALVPVLSLISATPFPALAKQAYPRVDIRVDYRYGESLQFTASVDPPLFIRRAAVFYRPSISSETKVAIANLSEDLTMATSIHDLSLSPFPPFSQIIYWWQIDFMDGTALTTDQSSFTYLDDRFNWNQLAAGAVAVHWYEGDIALGQTALDTTVNSLQRIQHSLLLPSPQQINVYLYLSMEDLQSGLALGGANNISGRAITELGVILLAISPGPVGIQELERGIPHELTHILLYQQLGTSYLALPAWLNEGLATLQETSPDPAFRLALEEAISHGSLLPLETLCSAFPLSGSDSFLAYSQSASLVEYIRDAYGIGGIIALLHAYQEGTTCRGGVERVLRRSLEDLQAEWIAHITPSAAAFPESFPTWLWAIPLVLLLALAISLWVAIRRKGNPSAYPSNHTSTGNLPRHRQG